MTPFAAALRAQMRPSESQQRFAQRLGYSQGILNRWLLGFATPPVDTVLEMAEKVGADPAEWVRLAHPHIARVFDESEEPSQTLSRHARVLDRTREEVERFSAKLGVLQRDLTTENPNGR